MVLQSLLAMMGWPGFAVPATARKQLSRLQAAAAMPANRMAEIVNNFMLALR